MPGRFRFHLHAVLPILTFIWLLTGVCGSSIRVIARQPKQFTSFDLDLASGNISSLSVLLPGLVDRFTTHFILDVNRSQVAYVHGRSDADHDQIRTFRIGAGELSPEAVTVLGHRGGIADDVITSQAIDWVTGKVYITVDRIGTRKQGRIEACPLSPGPGCTILLSNEFGMHSLVVDPIEGYMYWLNKDQNRIEAAWMNGEFMQRFPFQDSFADDPKVTVASLALDPVERKLFYLRVWHDRCEIVGCKLHNRTSCRVIASLPDAAHLIAYKGRLFWNDIRGRLWHCLSETCPPSTKVVTGVQDVERFQFLDPESQPARVSPNPCAADSGCSHFCLLIPGEPWRKCSCPVGVRLLSDNATCDPAGVRHALLVASRSSLFFVSLDTRDFAPTALILDPAPTNIVAVDYDPLRQHVYWLNASPTGSQVQRRLIDGNGTVETLAGTFSATGAYLAVDWLGQNVFVLDPALGKLEVQRIDAPSDVRRTLLSSGFGKACCLQLDPRTGVLYFANTIDGQVRLERVWLDGTHRQTLFNLPKTASVADVVIDIDHDTVYWLGDSDGRTLASVRLGDGSEYRQIATRFHDVSDCTRLGDTLYCRSPLSRSITAVAIGPNHGLVTDTTTSSGAGFELFDLAIFHLTALKAVALRPTKLVLTSRSPLVRVPTNGVVGSVPKTSRGCYPSAGACDQICVNLPDMSHSCLCGAGFELQEDGKSCRRPTAFFVFSQSNVSNDLLRISTNKDAPNYDFLVAANVTSAPEALAVDSRRRFIYFAVENRHERTGAIRRVAFEGGVSQDIVSGPSIRNTRGLAVDPVTGAVFWTNGYLRRIQVTTSDGAHVRSLFWASSTSNPQQLAVHSRKKRLFFVNAKTNESSIMSMSITGAAPPEVIVTLSERITALIVNEANDRLYFATISDLGGAVTSIDVNGGPAESRYLQITGGAEVRPTALTTIGSRLFVANDVTKAIEFIDDDNIEDVDDDGLEVLHAGVANVRSLLAAVENHETIFNPCTALNVTDAICLNDVGNNATLLCEDQFDLNTRDKTCSPPSKFLLLAAKNRFLRYRIRHHGVGEDPFVVLPVTGVGHPSSVVFDSLSPRRFIYWIDVHDHENGRLRRSPDAEGNRTTVISLTADSNCSLLFDLAIDEIGRQLFVSCAPKDAGDVAFVHVWRILDDDTGLDYVGKVVAGDVKSSATNNFPVPRQIAVFGRLNALFYADCSRQRDSPAIVRCHINGRQCQAVVTRGVDCATLQLKADLSQPRLVYTTTDGIWSRDVYVDRDLRRLVDLTDIAASTQVHTIPLDERAMLVVVSNESRHEEKFLELQYDMRTHDLAQLPSASWVQPPSDLLGRVTAAHVVGTAGIDPSKVEFSCRDTMCSHLCLVPYDTGSLINKRYECLCPLEFSPSVVSSYSCEPNLACASWQFRCSNGKQCIHIAQRCDGVPDCNDWSDEHTSFCPAPKNHPPQPGAPHSASSSIFWTCDGGKTTAVGLHLLCNGFPDCDDGSDEKHCRCHSPKAEFDCFAWQKYTRRSFTEVSAQPVCISRAVLCDGVSDCQNGADELPTVCSLLWPTSSPDTSPALFDFSTRQPAYVIVVIAIASALAILLCLICIVACCCQQHWNKHHGPGGYDTSTTVFSGQPTMMTTAATPTQSVMHTRVLLPSGSVGPPGQQVEVALRTYPCSATGTSDYGYGCVPAGSHVYSTLPWRGGSIQSYGQHQSERFVVLDDHAPSSVMLPHPGGAAFCAPPPSAASLSTYGVVKPAGMRVNMGGGTGRRPPGTRRTNKNTPGRRCDGQMKQELLEYVADAPPTYSGLESAVECSTPKSGVIPRVKSKRYDRNRRPATPSSTDSSDDSSSGLLTPTTRRLAPGAVPPANSSNTTSPSGVS